MKLLSATLYLESMEKGPYTSQFENRYALLDKRFRICYYVIVPDNDNENTGKEARL